MSLVTGCGYALLRGLGVGAAAVLAGSRAAALLSSRRRTERTAAWLMLVVVLLTPVILVGYAYSGLALSLVRHPALNELLYDLLVWMKLVPVAALLLHFAPRSMSARALHCHRLLRRGVRAYSAEAAASAAKAGSSLLGRIKFWMRSSGRVTAAFAVVFLLAFGEFEMASLLDRPSWTKWLFEAQVDGLLLSGALLCALLPFLIEIALLGAVLALLLRRRPLGTPAGEEPQASGPGRAFAWACLATPLVAVTGYPLLVVLRGTIGGLQSLIRSFAIGKEIGTSVVFALSAATLSYVAAGAVPVVFRKVRPEGRNTAKRTGRSGARLAGSVALCAPGLLGALVLSLVVLAIFQLPLIRAGRDGVVPLLLALTLLLLPFALLLRALLHGGQPRLALYLAQLIGRSPAAVTRRRGLSLAWDMNGRKHFRAALILFVWAYFDMTCSSLLAPTRMTPVWVTLYNHMHYGQMAVLSARVFVAFCVPLALLLLAEAGLGTVRRILA